MPPRNIALTIMVSVDETDTPRKIAVKGVDDAGNQISPDDYFFVWLIGAQWIGSQEPIPAKGRLFAKSVFEQYMKAIAAEADAPCQVCGVTFAKHSPLAGHPHVPVPPRIAAARGKDAPG